MTPIKLDTSRLLGFDRSETVGAKIGDRKKPGAKVGPIKKIQGAKIGLKKSRTM